jgi:hypothetical protein
VELSCPPLPTPSSTTAWAAGSFKDEPVYFLLAIRSRQSSLGQEAPDLTFDGTLISDLGFETFAR